MDDLCPVCGEALPDSADESAYTDCYDCWAVVHVECAVLGVEVSRGTMLDPPERGDLCLRCYEKRQWREGRLTA